jgi:hypothetical protein
MPISVRYKNQASQECILRPTPLVSINTNTIQVGDETVGVTYDITLNGTILADLGAPFAQNAATEAWYDTWNGTAFVGYTNGFPAGPYKAFDASQSHAGLSNRPPKQKIPITDTLDAMLFKQKVIRSLFGTDGQRMEIIPVHGDGPAIICYPKVVSVTFEEGVYIHKCGYSITLQADTLLNKDYEVDNEGNPVFQDGHEELKEEEIAALKGYFINSFSDNWSIEVDEAMGETVGNLVIPRSYRITHSASATGKTHYYPKSSNPDLVVKSAAWQNAKKYVQNHLLGYSGTSGVDFYPSVGNALPQWGSPYVAGPEKLLPNETLLGSGTLNLVDTYRGYNHVRTEQIDKSTGSYSVSDTWLLASGNAYETYSMSISQAADSPFINVSIDGSIKGLSELHPDAASLGGNYGDGIDIGQGTAYSNAISKFHEVSNSGKYGIGSNIFKRANRATAVMLNAQPQSISLGTNEYDGEITYSLAFNNRPTNIISGVLSENISVNDNYPGDIFATIPVIGRNTGPVLQYVGGRTAYNRSVNIELVMDYTDIGYGSDRKSLLLKKPSIVEPTKSQLRDLIKELSPQNEPGVRKYFIAPPSESWTPKEGRYTFNISWTYELDK